MARKYAKRRMTCTTSHAILPALRHAYLPVLIKGETLMHIQPVNRPARPTRNYILQRSLIFGLLCLLSALLVACSATTTQVSATSAPKVTPTPKATPTSAAPTVTKALVTYTGHTGPAIGVTWSPDGKKLASCGNDGTIQVWNAQTGKTLWKVSISQYAFAVAWSPDGKKIAGGGGDGSVTILDASNGKQLAVYIKQIGAIEGLAWSPDSTRLVSGSQDKTADILNVQTGKLMISYTGHTDGVERVAWSPDGSKIASASHDGTVQIWNASNGQHLLTYNGNGAPVWEVAWSPNGQELVSSTGSAGAYQPVLTHNSIKVWNATTGQTRLTYPVTSDQTNTYALAWSPDGKSIASAGDNEVVRVWDAETGKIILQYANHHDVIFKVAWSPDSSLIASASVDGTVQVWQPHI